jgi:hypothetical protein
MKKFLVDLMALGLCMAFAMPAAAVDFKLGGMWYTYGMYAKNPSLLDPGTTAATDGSWANGRIYRGTASYYGTKLTLKPQVVITEGLTLNMQLDGLEKLWGDTTYYTTMKAAPRSTVETSNRPFVSTGGGSLLQENLEFEQAWVDFKVPVGQFRVGYLYQSNGFFGTRFLQQPYTRPQIIYNNTFGPVAFEAAIAKLKEHSNRSYFGGAETGQIFNRTANGIANDSDGDLYMMQGVYKFNGGDAGLAIEYWRDTMAKVTPNAADTAALGNLGYSTKLYRVNPYAKYKIGNFYVEGEAMYTFGKLREYEGFAVGSRIQPDVDVNAWGAYVMAQYDFKPFFAGAKFAYKSGDKMDNADKRDGTLSTFYLDDYNAPFAGTLILFGGDYTNAMLGGSNVGNATNYPVTRYADNMFFYQIFAGANPTPKTNVTVMFSYAQADKKPRSAVGAVGATTDAYGNAVAGGIREYVSDKIGMELDLTASYKIFDNLVYSVGAGYLWADDYFKGFDNTAAIKDNYILTHKLQLNF